MVSPVQGMAKALLDPIHILAKYKSPEGNRGAHQLHASEKDFQENASIRLWWEMGGKKT